MTLVELVVVIVVLAILAAVAVPKLSGTGFEDRTLRDNVLASLRFAQKAAVSARRTVCATFVASPSQVSYRISTTNGAADCTTGSALIGPDGSSLVVTASGSAAFASAPTSLIFDAAGRPDAAKTISIAGLDSSLTLTVEAETGYVH